jgi:diaminohydroxyphosphoribosylaminopyrimidine deaminase/5-amino-6-(5-phosphoribosylamino)uracil reductase
MAQADEPVGDGERNAGRTGPEERVDSAWMRRALRLAHRGYTHPNPMVGCVLVRDGAAVGEGWHRRAGEPHAEVEALRAAGDLARGATAYVALEPCSHFGRTPPCADALVAAGVARVVAAVVDPNPAVSGAGLERLRAAGVTVCAGTLETEARRLNAAFFHFQTTGRPFVTLKAAMTLDGKIATRTGDSRWVTGARARRYVHEMRARSGAVLVGMGTLLRDDPELTARPARGEAPRQPLRVIVDSHLRTPPSARVLLTAGPDRPVLIATTRAREALQPADSLRREGVEIVSLPASPDGRVDLGALMALLAERQIGSVLAEGGAELHGTLVEQGYAHSVIVFIAPKVVGGRDAPTPVGGTGLELMSDARHLTDVRVRRFGPDIAIEGLLPAASDRHAR